MNILAELAAHLYQDLTEWSDAIGMHWRIMEEYAHVTVQHGNRYVTLTPRLGNIRVDMHDGTLLTNRTVDGLEDLKLLLPSFLEGDRDQFH